MTRQFTITEVRIKLIDGAEDDRLLAFATIVLDSCFAVRDLKVIEGIHGRFVAMPDRRLSDHCPECNEKNHFRANYCNQCGLKLGRNRATPNEEGRIKLFADVAHPITTDCRDFISRVVLDAYRRELELSKNPNYVSRYEEYGVSNA